MNLNILEAQLTSLNKNEIYVTHKNSDKNWKLEIVKEEIDINVTEDKLLEGFL